MALPIAPRHLKQYKQIARLLLRHWDGAEKRLGAFDDSDVDMTEGDPTSTLADDLEALGPTYVKLGQMLRTRPDIVTPEAHEALGRLHDAVEPIPFPVVREVIESELGARLQQLFATFEEHPVGSASLGQVHRAQLRDGTPVAVKVQRPEAATAVRADLDVLADVGEFLATHTDLERRYGLQSTIEEFRVTMLAELDYRSEADNLRRMGSIVEEFERLRVPRVIDDYSTNRVLTMEFEAGSNVGRLHGVVLAEHSMKELAEQLFDAYLTQALVHGFVHSDPHPGNLILTPTGELAIVDLGQVAHISSDIQERLLRLILAVADGDGSDAAAIVERMGVRTDQFDAEGLRTRLARIVARESQKSLEHVRLGPLLLEVAGIAGSHGLRVPAQLGILGKTILNLEEVATILDPTFQASTRIRQKAPRLVARRMTEELDPGAAFRKALEAKRFATALPSRLDAILETASEGRFRVQMQLQGEQPIVLALTRMANRIASALVLAALIVGASLLTQVDTPFTVLGYPGIAVVFFVLAAMGGVHLLWRIWRTTEERPKR